MILISIGLSALVAVVHRFFPKVVGSCPRETGTSFLKTGRPRVPCAVRAFKDAREMLTEAVGGSTMTGVSRADTRRMYGELRALQHPGLGARRGGHGRKLEVGRLSCRTANRSPRQPAMRG